jgi:hypothetical protein
VLLPLTAVIWVLNAQNGPTSPAPVVSTPAAVTQSVSAPASVTITLDNATALPRSVSAGQIVPFSFTLTNTGAASGSFSYKVYVVWNSGERDVIDSNSVSIAADASSDISESLKFESASAMGKIYIQTTDPAQSINFDLPR